MTGKIKPKNFQKRREQSQTFRDWHDEHKAFIAAFMEKTRSCKSFYRETV